jgi:hypothetical protein
MLPVPNPKRAIRGNCPSEVCLLKEVEYIHVSLFKRNLCSKCEEDLRRIIENINATP